MVTLFFLSCRQLDLFYEGSNNDFEAVLAEIEQEMSMADILRELGYGCTFSTSHCKEMLSLFLPLNEVTLSKLLGTIARTHVGLDDAQNIHLSFCSALGTSLTFDPSSSSSWNVDVLVDSIKQLVRDFTPPSLFSFSPSIYELAKKVRMHLG